LLIAVVALLMGLRCPPDSAMGAPSFVAAFILTLPLVKIALLLLVGHGPSPAGRGSQRADGAIVSGNCELPGALPLVAPVAIVKRRSFVSR
jgi:hypothetical protein